MTAIFKHRQCQYARHHQITNDGSANSSPGDAFGTTNFRNATTASSIDIVNKNSGATNFYNTASAATASITNRVDSATSFFNSSTAGQRTIVNNSGTTNFLDQSSASLATITNKNGGSTVFGSVGGIDTADAGSSNITNLASGGANHFQAQTTAGLATIDNNGGATSFFDVSNAGSANITPTVNGGFTLFDNTLVSRECDHRQSPGQWIYTWSHLRGDRATPERPISPTRPSASRRSARIPAPRAPRSSIRTTAPRSSAPSGDAADRRQRDDHQRQRRYDAIHRAVHRRQRNHPYQERRVRPGSSTTAPAATRGLSRVPAAIVDFSQTTGLAGDGKITAGSIAGRRRLLSRRQPAHRRKQRSLDQGERHHQRWQVTTGVPLRHPRQRRVAGKGRRRHADPFRHQQLYRRHHHHRRHAATRRWRNDGIDRRQHRR